MLAFMACLYYNKFHNGHQTKQHISMSIVLRFQENAKIFFVSKLH